MLFGLPYDSDEGRQLASHITALLTGIAYITSNKIAERLGCFDGFYSNKDCFYDVMFRHYKKVSDLVSTTIDKPVHNTLINHVDETWKNICDLVDRDKPFRNAQVTLLAPTGTISWLMDAQTTGIEPEYSHVKYKRLSNTDDGVIKITSDVTKKCLENLGYCDKDISEIECFITDDKSLDLCKCLKKEHKNILNTSTNIYRDQTIHYSGHIKMLAAVQPFISGGISKTVNFPNDCGVEDIFKCYVESWKLGLKGIAIYRDGSKSYQPLSNKVVDDEDIDEGVEFDDIEEDLVDSIRSGEYPKDDKLIKYMHSILAQKKLGDEVPSITHKFSVGQVKGWITSGMYPSGDLGQIFIDVSKQGSTLSGLFDCISILTSISLQRGVPLKDIVEKMIYQTFSPSGFTSNPQIRTATSIVDYIFKYLGLRFLNKEDQIELGLIKEEEVYDWTTFDTDESNHQNATKKFAARLPFEESDEDVRPFHTI
jgi:ribonucleoside-diphosphate reductase alpha chain